MPLRGETPEKVAGSENPEVENDLATVPKPLEGLTTAWACSADEGIGLFQRSRLQAAVLDAGPNRERMIDEAHAMNVARGRDLLDAADFGRCAMVPLETDRNDPVSARSALFVARFKA